MLPISIGVSILKEEVWFNVFTILLLFFKSKSLLKVSGAPVGPVRSWLLRDSARLRGPDRGERTSGVSNKSIKDHELKVNFFWGGKLMRLRY